MAGDGGYVDVGGHPTWVADWGGGGEPLVLLHGGFDSSDTLLGALGPGLAERFRVVAFDRRGHGRTADTDAPFSYADMAAEAAGVLEAVVGGRPAHLVGYSSGGIVALLVALRRPDLVRTLVLVGTNYHHDGLVAGALGSFGPGSRLVALVARAYAERSPDGPGHFPTVAEKTLRLFATEPALTTDDVARVVHPALVVAGDDDAVSLAHTCSLYEALPAGQLAIVPGASHLVVLEKPDVVGRLLLDFLAADGPPQTLRPLRRRA